MATTEQFSLRWNNFHSNLTSGFHQLLEAAEMVDVTLAVEGHFLQAHKIVLSICSPYFKQMFKVNPCEHPIVIIKDVGHENMKDILEFMYMGEVSVLRENLSSFLRTAEVLQVKGLTGDDSSDTSSRKDEKLECENDDDSEILHYNPIEPEVELPSYVPPRIPSPPATSQFGTKRHTKGPNASTNSKRAKSEATPNQNKIKTESDVNIQNECNNEITLNIDENPNLNLVKTDNEDIKDIPKNTIWENSIGSSGSIDPNSSEQACMWKISTTSLCQKICI